MYLRRLSLTNFRIFSRLELQLPRKLVLFSGANAQGKTSILEAVAYLANFSSFHANLDRQLVNFTVEDESLVVGRIVGEYVRQEKAHVLEVRLILERGGSEQNQRFRRETLLDGVKKPAMDLFGQFNAVLFLPQITRIIEGGPADRRAFLDEVLSQAWAGYSRHLSLYNKALQRRNALLKMVFEGGGDVRQLSPWDAMIAEHGAELIFARIHVLRELEELSFGLHQRLTRGAEVLRFVYLPSWEPIAGASGHLPGLDPVQKEREELSIAELRQGFLLALQARYREDVARGSTSIGPHRDEVRFLCNRVDLGFYGSRGQIRTALLSLKLAELQWMKERSGEWPVLLLDEIMAELDPQRREDLQLALRDVEQALLTSTDAHLFREDFVTDFQVMKVENGVVSPL